MKTDLYTKAILTVIAVFLGIIIFQNMNLVPTVQAAAPSPMPTATTQSNVVDVRIVETKKPVEIDIKKINGSDLDGYDPRTSSYYQLPVRIMNK